MWHEMFVLDVSLIEKVLRTLLVYVLILVLIRLVGNRALATVNTVDVVVALLLASVVENAIIGDDQTVVGGVIGAVTLVTANHAINHLVNVNAVAARLLRGKATTVIEHGTVDHDALHRLRMTTSELDHAIRGQHGDDISEIEHGQLTPSGQLVLTLKYDEQSSTKADIAALADQLRRVEALLTDGRMQSAPPAPQS